MSRFVLGFKLGDVVELVAPGVHGVVLRFIEVEDRGRRGRIQIEAPEQVQIERHKSLRKNVPDPAIVVCPTCKAWHIDSSDGFPVSEGCG
jgi:hypothetical protein